MTQSHPNTSSLNSLKTTPIAFTHYQLATVFTSTIMVVSYKILFPDNTILSSTPEFITFCLAFLFPPVLFVTFRHFPQHNLPIEFQAQFLF